MASELSERGEDDNILNGAKERARVKGIGKDNGVSNTVRVVMFESRSVFNAFLDILLTKREREETEKEDQPA